MHLIDIINHMKRVKEAMAELGGEAWVNTNDFSLHVKVQDKQIRLGAQFALLTEGRRSYTVEFTKDVATFNGWYPALNKLWEISSEKLKIGAL
jgi:hypothetical protein